MFIAITISITISLIALAALLLILDVFFATDALSLIAYAVAATTLSLHAPTGPIGIAIIAVVLWFVFAILHYAVYRRYIFRVLHRHVAPQRHADATSRIVGKAGVYKTVDGVAMIEIEGDLWPAAANTDYQDGERVRICSFRDGELTVTKA